MGPNNHKTLKLSPNTQIFLHILNWNLQELISEAFKLPFNQQQWQSNTQFPPVSHWQQLIDPGNFNSFVRVYEFFFEFQVVGLQQVDHLAGFFLDGGGSRTKAVKGEDSQVDHDMI